MRALSNIRRSAVALAVLALLAGPAVLAQGETRTEMSDLDISMAVDDQLAEDVATPAYFIDVTTADGIVTLDGSVTNILAKERAADIAATVRGVRGVVNRIEVLPTYREDVEIQEDVKGALITDPATDSWEIVTSVDDGVVRLTGTVDSMQEKQLAAIVAKGVYGVRDVDNRLAIDYDSTRTDAEIRDEILQTLLWDSRVDSSLINVAVNDGNVELSGTVGSSAERGRAWADGWVRGVKDVDTDELHVQWWARDDRLRQNKYVVRADDEVEKAVEDSLLYDPRVSMFNVKAEVSSGDVTLRGTVDNLKARRAAGQDARNVVGVWSVDNKIKVRPSNPSDRTIESNVEDALLWDPYVERYQIAASVVDGEVYLYGTVDSTFEKGHAEDVASRQVGVIDVHNYLDVNDGADILYHYDPYVDDWYVYDYDWYTPTLTATTASDWEIEEDINDEMFWSPFVEADQVNVSVNNGIATLTGTVDTWNEREAATENAFEGGAIAVDNDLLVDYGPEYYR